MKIEYQGPLVAHCLVYGMETDVFNKPRGGGEWAGAFFLDSLVE